MAITIALTEKEALAAILALNEGRQALEAKADAETNEGVSRTLRRAAARADALQSRIYAARWPDVPDYNTTAAFFRRES